ncbi:MAG: oligosaccharide flippase family protein [Pseudomonadota bacterium]
MAGPDAIRAAAIRLALAGALEYGLQVVAPAVLVRYLDAHTFGQYRLLWLMAVTAIAIAPCFVPQSLFYFLPRATTSQARSVLLGNSLLFLVLSGLLVALVTSAWNPVMPQAVRMLFTASSGLSAMFLWTWVVAAMFDVLPTADGRARWQASTTALLAVVRTMLLCAAAMLSADLYWVIAALLAVAAGKVLSMGWYLRAHLGGGGLQFERAAFLGQLQYALPFALGNALFLLRLQSDQWVVATIMPTALFAAFSIATVFQPIATLVRQPVLNAAMAPMSAAFAAGRLDEMRALVARTSSNSAFFLLPVAAGLFVIAPEVVTIVYTNAYQHTTPVMRVYLVGMMISALATGHLMPVIGKGWFATLNNSLCLAGSVAISIFGARLFGLPGAALGSVLALLVSESWAAWMAARTLQTGIVDLLGMRSLTPVLAASGAAMLAASAGATLFSAAAVPTLAFKCVVFSLTWLAVLLALGQRARLVALVRRH